MLAPDVRRLRRFGDNCWKSGLQTVRLAHMITQKQLAANRQNSQRSTGPKTTEGKAVVARNAVKHGLLSRLGVLPGVEEQGVWEEHLARVCADLQPASYLEESLASRIAQLLWRLGRAAQYEQAVTSAVLRKAEENWVSQHARGWPNHNPLVKAAEQSQQATAVLDLLNRLPDLPGTQEVAEELADRITDQAEVWAEENDVELPGLEEDQPWDADRLRLYLDTLARQGKIGRDQLLDLLAVAFRRELEEAQAVLTRLEGELDDIRRTRLLPETPDLEKVRRYETTLERSFYKALHEL